MANTYLHCCHKLSEVKSRLAEPGSHYCLSQAFHTGSRRIGDTGQGAALSHKHGLENVISVVAVADST